MQVGKVILSVPSLVHNGKRPPTNLQEIIPGAVFGVVVVVPQTKNEVKELGNPTKQNTKPTTRPSQCPDPARPARLYQTKPDQTR